MQQKIVGDSIFDAKGKKTLLSTPEEPRKLYYEMLEYGRRNISLMTLHPTLTTVYDPNQLV